MASDIAAYVARRLRMALGDLVPRLAGHVSLSLALTSYELWVEDEAADLLQTLADVLVGLRQCLDVR